MAGARQPIDLVLLKGRKNLTKAEIEERKAQEVKAPSDNVIAPTYLPKKLVGEFDKVAAELIKVGIMSNLDVDALARFLMSQAEYLRLSNALRSTPVMVTVQGKKMANEDYRDLLRSQDLLFKQCRAAASDLGLTISSRCKLVVPKKEEPPKTAFDERFGHV